MTEAHVTYWAGARRSPMVVAGVEFPVHSTLTAIEGNEVLNDYRIAGRTLSLQPEAARALEEQIRRHGLSEDLWLIPARCTSSMKEAP